MNHPKHPHTDPGESARTDAYWKRAHHDWKFWIALVLMLVAMGVYISTLDLAVQPDTRTPNEIKTPQP